MPSAEKDAGMERRYRVEKINDPTGKHAKCWFFVLDPHHDPHALVALRAYADSCRAEFPQLADDIEAQIDNETYNPHWPFK